MRTDEFFSATDLFAQSLFGGKARWLKRDRLENLRRGPDKDVEDLEMCIALANLVRHELILCGTSGEQELDNDEISLAIKALRSTTSRLGITTFDLPFRDFSGFQTHWVAEGCKGSWQCRRDLIAKYFDPLRRELDAIEEQRIQATLITSMASGEARPGWTEVDRQADALRRHFLIASTPEDYRTIGNDAVHLFEALGQQVYDPAIHQREREPLFNKGETKNRLERFIEDSYNGSENAELRKLVRAAIEYAQKIKHGAVSSRRDAVIVGNTVLFLTDILHQLSLPE